MVDFQCPKLLRMPRNEGAEGRWDGGGGERDSSLWEGRRWGLGERRGKGRRWGSGKAVGGHFTPVDTASAGLMLFDSQSGPRLRDCCYVWNQTGHCAGAAVAPCLSWTVNRWGNAAEKELVQATANMVKGGMGRMWPTRGVWRPPSVKLNQQQGLEGVKSFRNLRLFSVDFYF